TRQDKTRQDKTRQDKTRQDKTRQDKTRQDKTRQDKTRQDTNIINIQTNGILLKKQPEEFWKICRENDIGIMVTKYDTKLNYEELADLAKSKDVKFEIISQKSRKFFIQPLNINGANAKENFGLCNFANRCIQLHNGKLFTCNIPPLINHINKYFEKDFVVSDKDYVDIYKQNDITNILEFFSKPIPFCRYCDIKNISFGHDFAISKKQFSEWSLSDK
ncbi:MAG: hypothetical protein LBO69_08720, partial [Ignavibacteria bacterium]|nr:hypothetical protein [Ignavibacteria bacterium]